MAGRDENGLVRDEVLDGDEPALHGHERVVGVVRDEPDRASHGGRGVLALRRELALAAPPQTRRRLLRLRTERRRLAGAVELRVAVDERELNDAALGALVDELARHAVVLPEEGHLAALRVGHLESGVAGDVDGSARREVRRLVDRDERVRARQLHLRLGLPRSRLRVDVTRRRRGRRRRRRRRRRGRSRRGGGAAESDDCEVTATSKLFVDVFPLESFATQSTFVLPTGKIEPEAGSHFTDGDWSTVSVALASSRRLLRPAPLREC